MNEYNEIIDKLKNMGIYYWMENGQVTFENIPICSQNISVNLLNNNEIIRQEYKENDFETEEESELAVQYYLSRKG
jgi:hypothetical protein